MLSRSEQKIEGVSNMSGLNDNLKAAEKAVNYVRTMLPLGAGDAPEDVYFTKGDSSTCMLSLRKSYPDEITFGDQTDHWIRRVADGAIQAGCGNCAEQCAVAIEFLLARTRIDSLDFMAFDPNIYDHMFLVIGRKKDSTVTKISTWGIHAVICDPWYPIFPDTTDPGPWNKRSASDSRDDPLFLSRPRTEPNRRAYPAKEAWTKMTYFLPAAEGTLQVIGHWEI
jgi:hypothetical protein